jgi:hypothetical protein
MEMGRVGCPSVKNDSSTLRHVPEERISRLNHGGSLQSSLDLAKFSPPSKINESSKKKNIRTEDKQIDSSLE